MTLMRAVFALPLISVLAETARAINRLIRFFNGGLCAY
ncbi:hypothetical protein PULV_a4307 [Pseudoalteromonas ulvae UL12]|nr:hypothetical protein [Pseudoalteromonas ulvae UL12]